MGDHIHLANGSYSSEMQWNVSHGGHMVPTNITAQHNTAGSKVKDWLHIPLHFNTKINLILRRGLKSAVRPDIKKVKLDYK